MKSEAAVYMAAVLEYIVAEVANFFMLILVTHKLSCPLTFYCGKRINTQLLYESSLYTTSLSSS